MGRRRPIPLIRQIELRPVLDLLGEVGAPIGDLLTRAKLPARAQDAEGFAAARSLLRFVGLSADYAGIEDLGWRSSIRARVEQLGGWGERVSRCWTLLDAIQMFCALYTREVSFVELGLAFGTEQAWLWRRRELPPKDPRGEMHGEQFMLGSMIQVVRMAAGCQWTPPAIQLESHSSNWVFRVAGLGDSRVRFGGPVLAIAVPYDLLGRRLRRAKPGTPAQQAANVRVPNDFVGSLQQALAPLVNEIPLSLELGAEITNTSPRTLRRWLAHEGTSWRQIVDRVRFEACEGLILDRSLTLTEIAAEFGYSDQAHFTRAFLRWTGEAPSAYRRRRVS